jgi:hypothetical protein
VEAAYRRGDLKEKRKRMMDEWAKFCGIVAKAGNVVPIKKRDDSQRKMESPAPFPTPIPPKPAGGGAQ